MTLIVSRFQTTDVIAEEGEPHHKAEKCRVIISGLLIAGRVDRDAGAVSVSIPRLLDGSMAAGKQRVNRLSGRTNGSGSSCVSAECSCVTSTMGYCRRRCE